MRHASSQLKIYSSFLIAIILTILPLPHVVALARPSWIVLGVIYWNMFFPHRINIGTAWCIGILIDVLNGTLLGEHAFALVIISLIVVKRHNQLRMYPILQSTIAVFFLVFLYRFILYCLHGWLNDQAQGFVYFLPALTSMLLWPWIVSIMQADRRRLAQ